MSRQQLLRWAVFFEACTVSRWWFVASPFMKSFQAVGGLGNRIQDFIVGPSPPDTLESALAETGLPLFAIDLRRASDLDAVDRWLSVAHRMRTIGAVYNELLPSSTYFPEVVPDVFDVIFFVKRTTPARRNPELPKVIDPEFIRA